MAKAEWGVKRVCPSCSARFYDLNNDPTVCPACGESHKLSALSARKIFAPAPPRRKAKAAPVAVAEVEDAKLIDDDEDVEADLKVADDTLLVDDDDDGDAPIAIKKPAGDDEDT